MTNQHLIHVISSFRQKQLTIAVFFGGNSRGLLPRFSAVLHDICTGFSLLTWFTASTRNKKYTI